MVVLSAGSVGERDVVNVYVKIKMLKRGLLLLLPKDHVRVAKDDLFISVPMKLSSTGFSTSLLSQTSTYVLGALLGVSIRISKNKNCYKVYTYTIKLLYTYIVDIRCISLVVAQLIQKVNCSLYISLLYYLVPSCPGKPI